ALQCGRGDDDGCDSDEKCHVRDDSKGHGKSVTSKEQVFTAMPMWVKQFHCKEISELARADAAWRSKKQDDIISLPGRTLWSLEAALWCIYQTNSFDEAVQKAISLGGDADTIGAITGQLAGAIYGVCSI